MRPDLMQFWPGWDVRPDLAAVRRVSTERVGVNADPMRSGMRDERGGSARGDGLGSECQGGDCQTEVGLTEEWADGWWFWHSGVW